MRFEKKSSKKNSDFEMKQVPKIQKKINRKKKKENKTLRIGIE